MNNDSTEIYEQEYRQKEARYVWTARIALLLTFLFVILSGQCSQGSILQEILFWLGMLSFVVMWAAFYAHQWNRFKYKLTNKGVRTFLFFNRISEGFYTVMVAFSGFIKAGTDYFLKKKSRIEQQQVFILQRMEEIQQENRQSGTRIESQLISLREDIAEDTKLLDAIREDNAAALAQHISREQSLEKEISSLKKEILAIRESAGPKVEELETKLAEVKAALVDEQDRIDRLEEERDVLSKEKSAAYTFKDLLLGRNTKRKAAALEKMAREIAQENMHEKKEYLYELAKFYHAMVDLGYIRENESKFALLFHREYGNARDFDTYRRSFHNAVDRLIDYEYEDIQEEIEELVNG